jgi:hypothetical protein
MGTEYVLYDNGISRNKYKTTHSKAKNGLRRELAAIVYVREKLIKLYSQNFIFFL